MHFRVASGMVLSTEPHCWYGMTCSTASLREILVPRLFNTDILAYAWHIYNVTRWLCSLRKTIGSGTVGRSLVY
jgi:hypothetical protein